MSSNFVYTLSAKRGWLYLFHDDNAQWKDKYVIVVSSDSRQTDKLISVLVLGDSSSGSDVVPIKIPNVGVKYAHCGMVTYLSRHLLTDEISPVSQKTMKMIDHQMAVQYGLVSGIEYIKSNFYKDLYDELLAKVLEENA